MSRWEMVKLSDITIGQKGQYGIGAPAVDFEPFGGVMPSDWREGL